ncbi:arrestin domain-containing protein 3 isoform X2 [Aplysia californica]|uniref:Arrestin domain-containing protein 3 isoform X2 n=1 Tax=Aplysia californica TaxID=6500 RepID=A0ABM0JFT6_APLCA|nr:arrestin domain-containing protein 3 isoform X2 [Aplysia californica]
MICCGTNSPLLLPPHEKMTNSAHLELSLEQADLVYYSGDRIRGALVVHVAAPVTIAGVELRFRGAARARWRELGNEGTRKTEVEHEKEEIYFDDRFCLWGKDDGRWESREVLNRGRHLFPFQYKLPEGIPCSFEGPDASIRYQVHGALVRVAGSNISTNKTVTVLRDLDCKRDSEKKSPTSRHVLEDHAERTFSTTCCRPSRVSCSLCVLKRSYVPGETVHADVQIHNMTMRKSGPCRLQLKQLVTYGESFCRPILLEELEFHASVRAGQRRQWKGLTLNVPATCPSRLSKCRVIDVRYCVAIECHFSDSVLYAAVPITIATLPERGIMPVRWSYQECSTLISDDDIGGETNRSMNDDNFRPKYKFYDELRDIRKDKYFVLKLRQSPGVKRRQMVTEGGESRTDSDAVNESKA